jgi:hypothetical protein
LVADRAEVRLGEHGDDGRQLVSDIADQLGRGGVIVGRNGVLFEQVAERGKAARADGAGTNRSTSSLANSTDAATTSDSTCGSSRHSNSAFTSDALPTDVVARPTSNR